MKPFKILKLSILLITMLLFTNSCDKIFSDDKLTLQRTNYLGNELKINGYFYMITFDGDIINPVFFYDNGIIMNTSGVLTSDFDVFEGELQSRITENRFAENKVNWGVFQIDSNQIKIEKWYESSGGGLPVYINSGTILNDTTIQFTKSKRSNEDEWREIDDLYYFRPFSPKPDSTNSFIE